MRIYYVMILIIVLLTPVDAYSPLDIWSIEDTIIYNGSYTELNHTYSGDLIIYLKSISELNNYFTFKISGDLADNFTNTHNIDDLFNVNLNTGLDDLSNWKYVYLNLANYNNGDTITEMVDIIYFTPDGYRRDASYTLNIMVNKKFNIVSDGENTTISAVKISSGIIDSYNVNNTITSINNEYWVDEFGILMEMYEKNTLTVNTTLESRNIWDLTMTGRVGFQDVIRSGDAFLPFQFGLLVLPVISIVKNKFMKKYNK